MSFIVPALTALRRFIPMIGWGLGGVGPDGQHAMSLTDIIDGVRHGATPETRGQTGHSGGMSETGAVVDIMSVEYRPRQFLHHVIIFIGGLGRGDHGDFIALEPGQFIRH